MVSLDPELSKLFILLMSTSATFGSQNGSTFSNFLKRKLETSFLQHESKIEDSLRFFPDYTLTSKSLTSIFIGFQIKFARAKTDNMKTLNYIRSRTIGHQPEKAQNVRAHNTSTHAHLHLKLNFVENGVNANEPRF